MKQLDVVKVVVATVGAVVVILIMAVARAVIVFKVLFGVALALLGILVVAGSPGILPSKKGA